MDTTFQIEQPLEGNLPGAVLELQVQDKYGLDFLTSDGLGFLDPFHLGSMFSTVQLDQPDLAPLLYKLPKIRSRIINEVKKLTWITWYGSGLGNPIWRPSIRPVTRCLPRSSIAWPKT